MKKLLYFSGIVASALVLSFLDTQKAAAQWSASSAGIPLAVWDFENNSARATGETAVDQSINSGCSFDGKFGSSTIVNYISGAGSDYGIYFSYPGSTVGSAIQATGWDVGADPGIAATNYYQFTVNTHGFSGIQMAFDYRAGGALPIVGVNYSLDGGTTWVNAAPAAIAVNIGSWMAGHIYNFPAGANNLSNLKVRIYGYNPILGTGTLALDNMEFYGSGTVAGVGLIGTTLNENQIYEGNFSGGAINSWSRNSFALNGANTELVINNSGINIAASSTFSVASQGTVTLGNTGAITGNGSFTIAAGSTLKTANAAGITTGSTGSITTTGKTFAAGANYIYNGTSAQVTGNGLPTAIVSPGSVSAWNVAGVSLSAATSFASGSGINLIAGNLGGAAATLNAGAFIQRDNGGFTTLPVLGGAINVTYANLGVNALSVTTGSELPASASSLNNLTINKPGATINLNADATANGSLALTAGYIALGSNNLFLPYSATVTGLPSAASMVVATGSGMLRRGYIANASFQYPIGDGTNYTPITLNFTSGSFNAGAYAGTNVVAAKHPSNANTTNYLNRYWNVGIANMTSPVYAVTSAQYVTGDVTGTESAIAGGSYAGALPWTKFAAANTSTHSIASTAVITSNTSFSGISLAGPTVVVSAPSGVCAGSSVNISVISATGDGPLTYSWSPSSSLSAYTGTSVTASPTASTVYTVTVTDANGLTGTATSSVTVLTSPTVISGTPAVCTGQVTTLTSLPGGGTWSSDNIALAPVGATTGYVSGLAAGTVNITYLLPSGCYQSTVVTVNTSPAAIAGATTMCAGTTTTLTDASAGGTWYSSNSSIASIGSSSGIVTSGANGVAIITYTLPAGCKTTASVTVNLLPGAIYGTTSLCEGNTTTFTNPAVGGTWSSANTSTATISSAGVVTAVAAGVVDISYTLGTGCYRTTTITVNAAPAAISGPATICTGGTGTYTDAISGGIWSSLSPSVATIDYSAGVATGVAAGNTIITYTMPNGCKTTMFVTANSSPAAFTGSASVCLNAITTLSSSSAGGAWYSSDVAVGTVGSGTGVLAALSVGTTTVSYTLPTGCYRTIVATVNPLPAPLTGASAVCVGSTATLTDASAGGTWTSASTAVASINSTTGVITGVAAGTAKITYKLATGCLDSTIVTVNPLPSAITGTAVVCLGGSTTLADATAGGTWSSTNTGIATIDPATGVVSTVSAGTAVMSYAISTGCAKTATVTVNPLPLPVSGVTEFCVGATASLVDATTGGTWSSSNASIVSINTVTGVATGVATGSAIIVYKLSSGCLITTGVTVDPLPAAITGTLGICLGSVSTLADAATGGTWSSSNTTVATIGTAGDVSGLTAGTSTISYILPTGCYKTTTVTVNALPLPIGGTMELCAGTTTTLNDATSGGAWSSGNTAVATIGMSTGVVSGVSAGNAVITYKLSASGCFSTAVVTIDPLPAAIAGPAGVCLGMTATLSDASVGGTWLSQNSLVASVGASDGIITGNAAGTTTITYTLPTGCSITRSITVYSLPAAITGTMVVCEGSTVTLADPSTGGTWSSAHSSTATVSTGGAVTGVAAGNVNITYTLSTGCYATVNVTVNQTPTAITGSASVCNGSTTTLGNALTGGTWITSNALIAPIGSSDGIVTGMSNGTATITYLMPTGCKNTVVVTVNPIPPAISGAASVCLGYATTLTDPTGGGTWSSSDNTIATATALSPSAVTGVNAGIATITYTFATGCYNTITITVNSTPPAITGNLNVCVGGTTSLGNAMGGGSWGTSNAAIATVGLSTGVVSGIAAGNTNVTYTMVTGCRAVAQVTVNALPAAISGPSAVCIGLSATMIDASVGGTWVSSDMSVATVGSGSGLVVGVAAGTSVISYIQSTGCASTKLISVVPVPAPITGTTSVCVGSTSLLSNTNVGGTWTSSNPTVATVNYSTGLMTGMVAGTANITYTLSTGCNSVITVTVNPVPVNITGTTQVCLGSSITLHDASFGGTWTSSNPAIASVDAAGGVVTGNAIGASVISYTNSFGCYKTAVVMVNPIPPAISGSPLICFGSTSSLSDGSLGGTWSSSNTSVATISAYGVATSVSTGTATISYSVSTGCAATLEVTVNPMPSPVVGTTSVCVGTTTSLTNSVPGGNWSSGSVSIASVGSGTGVVTGISTGTTVITYSLATGCRVTAVVTVNAQPAAITGTGSLCAGSTISLSDASFNGSWTSSNLGVATINATGLLSGISDGIATITYTLPSGCYRTTDVTVNPLPSTISGTTNACVGNTTTLGNTIAGGIWTSSNPTVASIDVTSGVVTGNAAGTALITYTLGSGCKNSIAVTIHANPGVISGITTLCEGSLVTLSNSASSGTWSSDNSGIANIGISTGIINGVAAGITTITYTLPGGCYTTTNVTVNPAPPGIVGNIAPICVAGTATLSEAIPGGTWTSSNPLIASAGLSSGVVTGVGDGIATVTYTLAAGCNITTQVTVNAAPGPNTGVSVICIGGNTTLSNAQAGGTWSSSDGSIATINPLTGVVTGVNAGSVHITYVLGLGGCQVVSSLTVNPAPGSIVGNPTVCVAGADTLSNATPGGIWSSSNSSILSIDLTTGVAVAVAAGTAVVNYSIVGTGCVVTKTVTVNPLPAPVTGIAYVCVSSTTTLSNDSISGYWSSTNLSLAAVGSATGIVTGLNPGLDTILYTLPTGCTSKLTIQVNALPADIIGDSVMCVGTAKTLSDATAFGTWSTSNAAVAVLSPISSPTTTPSTAAVTGVTSGVVFISYTLGTGCTMAKLVTVNPSPAPIEGASSVCQGAIEFLYNSTAGGTWSSSDVAVLTIHPTGDIVGGNVGTAIVSYKLPTGCYATKNIVVNATPSDIFPAAGGPMSLCQNATLALADTLPGGVWSTSGGIATIEPMSGVLAGVTAGATYVTYTSVAGCLRVGVVTVFPSPDPIVGTPMVCVGSTVSLTDPTTGGTWSSIYTSLATVDTAGVVTGVLAGIDTIRYTSVSGCYAYVSLTVNPLPTAGTISGSSFVCLGSSTTLSDTVPGGVWSSSNAAIASIVDTSGIATGVSVGTVNITYSVTTICGTATQTTSLIVNPLPDAGTITGSHFVCKDHTTTLADAVVGGTWSISNSTYATVSSTGVVSGIAAGIDTVMYSVTTVCGTDVAKFTVTVNALAPHTNIAIHPDTVMCSNTLFQNFSVDSSAPSGLSYTWSAENAQVFAVSANGQNALVSFPTPGTAVVRLTTDVVASGCSVVDSFVATIGASVSANPEVKYYGGELICTDNTSDSYTWGYDDVNTLDSTIIPGEIHQDYYLPVPDFSNKNYWVITRHGDCYQKSYYNIPTSAVGTYTMNDISIKLFPNPTSSSLNIEVKGLTNTNNVSVRVTDMLGKDVQNVSLDNAKGTIGVSDLASGLYTVTIVQDNVKIGSKIFVKN